MPVFQQSFEQLRAQVINDLRAQELQAIRETCAAAARMIMAQNTDAVKKILSRR